MTPKYDGFRCYNFNNFYCQGIQAGIQSAHSMAQLFSKYMNLTDSDQLRDLEQWLYNYETMIVLNGGDHEALTKLTEFLDSTPALGLAWADFCESPGAMNGARTNVAVIVPARIYKVAGLVSRYRSTDLTDPSSAVCDAEGGGVHVNYIDRNDGFSVSNEFYTAAEVEFMNTLGSCRLM